MGLGDPDCDGVCVTEALPELVPESDADSVWLGDAVRLDEPDWDGVCDTEELAEPVVESEAETVWLGDPDELSDPVCDGVRETDGETLKDCDGVPLPEDDCDCVSVRLPVWLALPDALPVGLGVAVLLNVGP